MSDASVLSERAWHRVYAGVLLGCQLLDDRVFGGDLQRFLLDGPAALKLLLETQVVNLSPAIGPEGVVTILASVPLRDDDGTVRRRPFCEMRDADLELTGEERAYLARLAEEVGNVARLDVPDTPEEA
jgi:hypothetical protein